MFTDVSAATFGAVARLDSNPGVSLVPRFTPGYFPLPLRGKRCAKAITSSVLPLQPDCASFFPPAFPFSRMAEIVCFGEVMLRLTTPHFSTLADAPSLDVTFGGAEANVAVQLAQFGRNAAFVSRLPENGLGDRCIAELRGRGVDTSGVLRGGARMGVYFLEPGVGQRPGKVT